MTSISPYTTASNGWVSIQDELVSKDKKTQVLKETLTMGVIELTKTAGNAGMLGLVGVGTAIVAFAVFKIAALVIGILTFPTAIIPPIYTAINTLGGLTAAGLVGYLFGKYYGNEFFEQMKDHYNHSMHLFSEAKRVYDLDIKG